ncbi:MAG: restriction endonuclease [Candidatus Thiodiazotropha sp.]
MKKINPGLEFEKIVSEIQKQLDNNSEVSHDQHIVDRLGQRRQFDVVVRGNFAGQRILGVIECKNLQKKVGTPEVDAFNTKSQDVNANFKIIVSRRGFSKPAIAKANHYGIQTLSLLSEDGTDTGVLLGTKWYVDIYYWSQFAVTLQFVKQPKHPVKFRAEEVSIKGKPVIEAFYNYLVDEYPAVSDTGWVVNVRTQFETPQEVFVGDTESYLCSAIDFAAHRKLDQRQREVGWNGTGFYDWQKTEATFAPGSTMKSHSVPADFHSWEKRNKDNDQEHGVTTLTVIAHLLQLEKIEGAIDLDNL